MKWKYLLVIGLFATFFSGCEQEFIPDISTAPADLVVEGYIEAGTEALPPYVILTHSVGFFSEINPKVLNNLFVHNAKIVINDGSQDYPLSEICFNDLTPEQKMTFGNLLNVNLDSANLNFCVYLDPSFQLKGEANKKYELTIEAEGKSLSATTSIPQSIGLDSIWFEQPPGKPSDTLRRMLCYITDPINEDNYYRYFTSVNNAPFISGRNSVTDDKFFNGLTFKFPLVKSEAEGTKFDPITFGLYRIGDTAKVKWINIDKDYYDFFNTLEFNRANQGPFSSYTRIKTNIKGGLGIWGGSNVQIYTKKVK